MSGLMETIRLLNKFQENVIECGTIIVKPNNKQKEIIEIITESYTCNCKFVIACDNCVKSIIQGHSINGAIIKVYKKNVLRECKLNWFMIKCKC